MSEEQQKELGKILWDIANELRGSMNADDFRDYMLSFLFLKYLSDNYETAQYRKEEERYSRRVSMEQIEKNDFNLNISRYVSTAKPEPIVDIKEVNREIKSIEEEIQKAKKEHNSYLKELGLDLLKR